MGTGQGGVRVPTARGRRAGPAVGVHLHRAGGRRRPVSPLPADPVLIHTAQVAADGVVTATIDGDEASYRTAVDRTMERLLS